MHVTDSTCLQTSVTKEVGGYWQCGAHAVYVVCGAAALCVCDWYIAYYCCGYCCNIVTATRLLHSMCVTATLPTAVAAPALYI